jgi:phosphoribosyl 1,2-cyclic phosphodiesterase
VSRGFRLQLKFWGVRGSTPTPTQENLGYGGNTSCIEIRSGNGELLIIDGGTGIRNLGTSLTEEFPAQPLKLTLLLTHFHWDHIQGLPFFVPLYNPANEVTIYSFPSAQQIRERLHGLMTTPYFPVEFEGLAASIQLIHAGGEIIRSGDLCVRSFPLNHPQGACGYRVESNGAVIVFASDLEHGHPELDNVLREHAAGADVLIYDAQYTPDEYVSRRGWGHSTWLEATKVAKDAGVKKLILFHHDPSHTDAAIEAKVTEAKRRFEHSCAAREGMTVKL